MRHFGRKYLLETLKTLADDSRLTLLQLLHEQEYAVGDLAERVKLTEPTVSHHLSRLRESGLVLMRMVGNQRYYRVNEVGLARFKKLAGEIETLVDEPEAAPSNDSWIEALELNAEDKQVLLDHTTNGRLTHLPTKQKKTLVILRWLATLFQPDTLYTEPQVNTILKSVYEPDFVSLRRDLVDFGYLRRERGGGKYWLAPATQDAPEG
ncbi:MAG: metalloregulator ArsR/SmtB family transcription factor [Anaerolineae bacterium]|nr:metalloregulator ArsR/SmtB family transcription factor [Anaerolineae bacterium]